VNVNTGTVYPSYEKALEAGESPADLVTGPPAAIEKLSRMVVARKKRNARRKAKREAAAASRKRNRR
jgi:hypothetical protein